MVCQCDNVRVASRGSIGAGNLDVRTRFGYSTSVGLFVDFNTVSLHQKRLLTGVGDLPPTAEGYLRGEDQPRREYQREDSPSSLLLLRASTGSRAFAEQDALISRRQGGYLVLIPCLVPPPTPSGNFLVLFDS